MKKFNILVSVLAMCIINGTTHAKTINWYVDSSVYDTSTCSSGGDLILPTTPTKRGYTFMGWRPYIPIEYIQTSGTQWINPSITPNNNFRFKTKFVIDSMSTGDNSRFINLFSSWVSDCEGIGFYGDNINNVFNFYFLGKQSYASVQTGTVYEVDINASKSDPYLIINGTRYNHTTTCDTTLNLPAMRMFTNTKGKFYYFQIYDNGTLVRDMIPVKDMNNVPCMFDKVTGQFFYNAGTGSFTAGPEL